MTGRERIRDAVRRLRAGVHGERAVFLGHDRRVLAADGDGDDDDDDWRTLLREADARWDTWRAFERDDAFMCDGHLVVASWIASHGVLLVAHGPNVTLGLARLRMKPWLAELERALGPEDR